MDACVLRKVDDACQRRLLELDGEVVVGVYLALVEEKVCAKPKTSGPSAAAKGLQDLLNELKTENDSHKVERNLVAILRSLSKRDEKSWFEARQPTATAVLWLILCAAMSRLSELQSAAKPSSSLASLSNDIFKILAGMEVMTEGDEADSIDIYCFIKALVVYAVSSFPLRDKSHALRAFPCVQLQVDDILASFNPVTATAKTRSCVFDVCRAWVSKSSPLGGVQALGNVLARCASNSAWHRVYCDLASANPVVAALLVDEVDSICASKGEDGSYKRFGLDCLVIGLRACEHMARSSMDRLICIALQDQDSSLRILAWKTLAIELNKMSHGEQDYVRSVACDALLIETGKSVGAAILKLLATDLGLARRDASSCGDDDLKTRRVHEFLLRLMSQTNGQFPSSWIQDSVRVLARGRVRLPAELAMKNFVTGTKDGKQLIATVYRQSLIHRGAIEAQSELQGLARRLEIDSVVAFENFVGSVFEANGLGEKAGSPDVDRIFSACRLSVTSRGEERATTRRDIRASILLELAIMRTSTSYRPDVEELWRTSAHLLQGVQGELKRMEDNLCVVEAFVALRGLRFVVESGANTKYHADVEHSLETNVITLAAHYALQRETVRLIYALAKPQEKAYYCLAMSQEEAFADTMRLASFLTLIGVVAFENAQYLGRQQVQRKSSALSDELGDGYGLHRESTDYMEQFKNTVAMKNRIKNVKEASVSHGLLSAYLPLVERALETSQTNRVKVAALWTMGEFMKISPAVTEAYFGKLLSILTTDINDSAVCVACIDVWHALQPLMKPSRAKEQGVEIMYGLINLDKQLGAVEQHALKCLQSLVLDAQLRDDRLHHFSVFLASSDKNTFAATRRFFRSHFQKHPSARASSTIFDIYFALASQVRTKDIATKIATSLMEIATDVSFSLESLEVALAEELESANRCVHSLHLLNKFNFISAPTVHKIIGSIDRFLLDSSKTDSRGILEHILQNQLQRSREKSDRVALKDAIAKLKGQDVSGENRRVRRVPLNVESIGRHVDDLKHKR